MKDGKHLTRERLAAIWQARVGRLAAGADAQPAEIDHVASCDVCRREWELLGAAAQDLTPLPALHNSNAAPGCPSEMRLQVLAGGTLAGEDADALLEHAASCDHCGAVLRDAARTFQNEISPEEQQAIGAMRSSQADWQKQLAARLSATPRAASSEERAVAGKVQGRVTWAGWALAAAAAVVLIIGASVAWRSSQTPDVNRLLAQAYTERRPMELRIAGAERAPIRVERGPGGSTMERPVPLLEAESIISRKLAASPSDPTWLAARGRAELLNWNYEAAIKSLEQARDYGNDSPDLLIDLASAYFQRAEANSNRAIDYGHAIQLLGEVLGKNPAHPVALFNRAVACDRFFLYEQAIKDLNAFLQLPSQGAWSEEARALLARIQQAKSKSSKTREPPPENAVQAAAYLERKLQDPPAAASNDFVVEGLQTQALQKWLPAILHDHLPGSHAAPQSQWHALREFARLIKARHRDSWWMDFLKDAGSPDFAAAVGGLQKSAEANAKGDFGGALNQAGSAEHLFSRMNNHAGFLRARREHSYALRRLLRGSECVRLDPTALYRETGDHYVWLKSYALLELASCYAMVGEAGTAEKLAQEGMQLAQSSGYGSLQLFAFAHTATYGRGETNAWTTYREGLKRYWMFPAEPARGVEFYVGLRGLAEYREWPYLAYGVAIENAAIAAQSEATASLVPALYRLATAASRVGEIPIAAGTIARAYGAFASLPAETSRALMVPLELAQADIESAAGNYSAAIARLERLQPRLSEMSNDWVAFEVHKALGDFYRASGRVDPAIAKYWQTLEIAWSRIKTLGQEEVRLRNEQELVETCRALSGLLSLEKDRSDQGLAIWRNCRRLYSRSASPEVGNTLQALLAADSTPPETTLTIVRLEKKIGVWVSGKGRAQFFVLKEDAAHVIQVGRRFAKLCGNPASSLSQLQQDGATLYHWFMAPLGVDGRRNGRVLVDADQPFAQIPWQAIPNPRGEYLGDSVDVVLLTAAGKPDAARSGGDFNSKSSILIVADPRGVRDEFGKLPPLNDTRVEAQEIAARFAKPSVLLGAAARAGDVVAAFPSRSIFHFAGHALADSRSSFLVLSDRPLATSEILRQKSFSTRLVVLAACSTSDTEVGLADDRSLIRAFLSRGAHQVIASAWRVDSDTTRSMMNTFYSELTNGRSVSTALRSAIRSTKARPATAHPYFWAAFNIYGRG